jgi:plastocyanin
MFLCSNVRSVAFLLALATPGLFAGQALAAGPVKVAIKGFAFVPQIVTVAPGTTVTWTNADDDPHTVVANDKGFRSAALDTDDSYSFTFTKPGDYAYFCSLHPHMTGKVIVKAG